MLTVMVVDDDPLLCTAMRRKIEMIDRENQLGIQETLIAHSAQEAWGILQEKSVDILDQRHSNALSDGSGAGGQGKRGFPGDSGGDSERP